MDIDKCEIKILNSELPVNTYYEYKKTADMIVRIEDNTFINIEINRERFKDVEDRNSLFADKIKQMIIEKGESYKDIGKKIFIQLNLNAVDKLDENYQKIKYGEDEVVSYWKNSKRKYNENKIIVVKYLEYYRDLYYNKNEKLTIGEMWLVLLSSKSFQELYQISSIILDKDMKEELMRNTVTLMNNEVVLEAWQEELFARNADYRRQKEAREEGMALGIKKGINQGIEETIINMLKENMDIEVISRVTGKSKEEILEIKNKVEITNK